MIKTLKTLFSQDRERYAVPRKVQDFIPIRRIWSDGIFLVGNRYAKTFKFTDVNYSVASREEKESMRSQNLTNCPQNKALLTARKWRCLSGFYFREVSCKAPVSTGRLCEL